VEGIHLGDLAFDITNHFHYAFWCGDLNYRIDMAREDVLTEIKVRVYLDVTVVVLGSVASVSFLSSSLQYHSTLSCDCPTSLTMLVFEVFAIRRRPTVQYFSLLPFPES
jgi:hypothetical protein